MKYNIREENGFRYYEEGKGDVLILLHGLFGALSNFSHIISTFSKRMKVSIPLLPLFELPPTETTVSSMVEYVDRFVKHKNYKSAIVLGNSLGGHIALLYTLKRPEIVKGIVLTGSSGLFENSLGDTYPKKSDYAYIKEKTEHTFFDPKMASKELVDEVFEIVNNRDKAIRILYLAKSALRHNLRESLDKIKAPTLLVWGKNDEITPPMVAEEFHKLLPDSELEYIEECAHAPMMEQPSKFNKYLDRFLNRIMVTS